MGHRHLCHHPSAYATALVQHTISAKGLQYGPACQLQLRIVRLKQLEQKMKRIGEQLPICSACGGTGQPR